MAYLVQPIDTPIFYVDDSLLSAYQAAGYTQATAGQVAAWNSNDAYTGKQSAPPAPPLVKGVATPPIKHVR